MLVSWECLVAWAGRTRCLYLLGSRVRRVGPRWGSQPETGAGTTSQSMGRSWRSLLESIPWAGCHGKGKISRCQDIMRPMLGARGKMGISPRAPRRLSARASAAKSSHERRWLALAVAAGVALEAALFMHKGIAATVGTEVARHLIVCQGWRWWRCVAVVACWVVAIRCT